MGVVQGVKESLDIRIEHDSAPEAVEFEDPFDRLVAVASFDESERTIVKLGFEDRSQKPTYHFLRHAITNHRNAERSELLRTRAFRDVDATQRERPKTSGFQIPHQRREVFLSVGIKHFDAHLVYSGGPAIPPYRLEGLSHELGRNPPRQRVHLDLLHGEPFTLCNHGVRTAEPLGDVL